MTIFFIIVFIAELIVAAKVISVLKGVSANVACINNQVVATRAAIGKSMHSVSSGVKSAAKGAGVLTKFLEKRRRDAIISLSKGVLGIVIFLLIRKYPNKRLLSVVDVIYSLDNLLKVV